MLPLFDSWVRTVHAETEEILMARPETYLEEIRCRPDPEGISMAEWTVKFNINGKTKRANVRAVTAEGAIRDAYYKLVGNDIEFRDVGKDRVVIVDTQTELAF